MFDSKNFHHCNDEKIYSLQAKSLANKKPSPSDPKYFEFFEYFKFTQKEFDKRLKEIYNFLENQGEIYQPATDPTYYSHEDVIERVRQYASFNQLDGAWLCNAVKLGK